MHVAFPVKPVMPSTDPLGSRSTERAAEQPSVGAAEPESQRAAGPTAITESLPADPMRVDWHDHTRRLAAGDRASFELFYESFFQIMYQDARRLTGRDESTCLDLVQEAMLKAIRAIKPIGDYPHLRNWCGALVKSVAYDWLRREGRRRCESLASVDEPPQSLVHEPETEARWRWIEEQMLEAPRDLQQLFALRYRLGWTLEQIARRFGWKTGAVDGKLRRAIEQLRIKAEREF